MNFRITEQKVKLQNCEESDLKSQIDEESGFETHRNLNLQGKIA